MASCPREPRSTVRWANQNCDAVTCDLRGARDRSLANRDDGRRVVNRLPQFPAAAAIALIVAIYFIFGALPMSLPCFETGSTLAHQGLSSSSNRIMCGPPRFLCAPLATNHEGGLCQSDDERLPCFRRGTDNRPEPPAKTAGCHFELSPPASPF
jgi:hypothetical protein